MKASETYGTVSCPTWACCVGFLALSIWTKRPGRELGIHTGQGCPAAPASTVGS